MQIKAKGLSFLFFCLVRGRCGQVELRMVGVGAMVLHSVACLCMGGFRRKRETRGGGGSVKESEGSAGLSPTPSIERVQGRGTGH